jgi:hypothetical protein
MAKTISINDEIISTSKVNKAVRKGIARICQTSGLTPNEKTEQVKRYLANNRDVRAIVQIGNTLNVHTKGECASHYTYSL